jgi:FkbM family methyltransferase
VRPRRIVHWLARKAFKCPPSESEFAWYQDRWGNWFLLHPYFILDRQIIAFGAYDYALHTLVERRVKQGMICLDIGANIGAVSLHLAGRVGPSGTVYSFEPLPHLHKRLSQNAGRHRFSSIIKLQRMAVSKSDGETTLSTRPYDNPNQGMGSIVNKDGCLEVQVQVPTIRLDTFAKAEALPRIDFVKIDVQGAEPLVIEGACDVLRRFKPEMLLEVSDWDLKSASSSGPKLLAQVEALGYECFTLTRNGNIGQRIRSGEIDANFASENVYCRSA